jgi:hypothetical protein
VDARPIPSDVEEAKRWRSTALRLRMLRGQWRDDLIDRMTRMIGSVRRDAWGDPDMSSNVFANVATTLAVLYDVVPQVVHEDPEAARRMNVVLGRASWSAVMQGVQRDVLGLREAAVRYDVDLVSVVTTDPIERVRLRLRSVAPCDIIAVPDELESDQPSSLLELRDYDGRWVYEQWLDDGTVMVRDAQMADITAETIGDQPKLLDRQGEPILPYVLYHAEVTTRLWSTHQWQELVEGTLTAGVYWSFFGHALRNASWPQRYMLDATASSEQTPTGQREITADPAAVLELTRTSESVQPQIGAWTTAADPYTFLQATGEYERRLATNAGVPAADILRTSGDPRSGYALQLSTEGRRTAARRFAPAFRRGDLMALRLIARLVNAALGESVLPESGWRITYRSLPPAESELAARQQRILVLVDRGMMTLDRAAALLDPAQYEGAEVG